MARTVLFADDDRWGLRGARAAFATDPDVQALTAETYDELIAHVRKSRLDAIVADAGLVPCFDENVPDVPIVALTHDNGQSQPEIAGVLERLASQIQYVIRPEDPDRLRSIVLSLFEHDGALRRDPFAGYGAVDASIVDRALRIRSRMSQPPPLGALLVELGAVTAEEYASRRADGMTVADLLLDDGDLTPEDARAYWSARQASPEATDRELLLERALVSEVPFLHAVCHADGLRYVEPRAADLDPRVVRRFSVPYMRHNRVLPIGTADNVLTVGMATPRDRGLRQELERMTESRIRVAGCAWEVMEPILDDIEKRSTTGRR